jgi:RimJ/RimL family protein N-acetyltransferase
MVKPRPVEEESLDELFNIGRDREIWRLTSVDYSDPANFYPNFKAALQDMEHGKAYPFLVCQGHSDRVIGTTWLLDIHPNDKKFEIGVTWIVSEFWGGGINTECKQLLLEYCFEPLGVKRGPVSCQS